MPTRSVSQLKNELPNAAICHKAIQAIGLDKLGTGEQTVDDLVGLEGEINERALLLDELEAEDTRHGGMEFEDAGRADQVRSRFY
jgi:hypothetical protein